MVGACSAGEAIVVGPALYTENASRVAAHKLRQGRYANPTFLGGPDDEAALHQPRFSALSSRGRRGPQAGPARGPVAEAVNICITTHANPVESG